MVDEPIKEGEGEGKAREEIQLMNMTVENRTKDIKKRKMDGTMMKKELCV